MTPSAGKIDFVLLAHFGIKLDNLPDKALYELKMKRLAKSGAARGVPKAGPTNWAGLRKHLAALMHIRNGVAHGDRVKLRNQPTEGEGALWVPLQGGGWSIQQPHGLNGLRVVVAVYNAVAMALDVAIDDFAIASDLKFPNDVVNYS